MTGFIKITNNDANESLQDIFLELQNDFIINSIKHFSGNDGYISKPNPDINTILLIPDLGPKKSAIFRYTINKSHINAPVNYSTIYSSNTILAGLPVKIEESFKKENNLSYCINETIFEIQSKKLFYGLNTSYEFNFSKIDSKNDFDLFNNNHSITYVLEDKNCLFENKSYGISYLLNTPRIDVIGNFQFANGSLSYKVNDSISDLSIINYGASVDLDLKFSKAISSLTTENNSNVWKVISQVSNPTQFIVNLTKVSLWVSKQGQFDPNNLDSDFINQEKLFIDYTPKYLLNTGNGDWDNKANTWNFNYENGSSPIIWMDIDNLLVDNSNQLSRKEFTQSAKNIFVKEIYLTTGYWLEVTKNIDRISDDNYRIKIIVQNLGLSPTPSNEPIIVYNYLPNGFNITSEILFSNFLI